MSNGECLFCQISSGQIPALKVAETENVIAFLDINPVNPGHILIAPKKHFADMAMAEDEVLAEMALLSKKVAKAIMVGLDCQAFNLILNNGRLAGQVIPHLHWHIIPRNSEDGLQPWPGKKYLVGEAEAVAEKIKAALK